MKHDAFRYDFTLNELIYFLFNKKRCPKCGEKMIRKKNFETVSGSTFNSRSAAPFVQNANVKHYIFVYVCQKCGSEYTLKELSN